MADREVIRSAISHVVHSIGACQTKIGGSLGGDPASSGIVLGFNDVNRLQEYIGSIEWDLIESQYAGCREEAGQGPRDGELALQVIEECVALSRNDVLKSVKMFEDVDEAGCRWGLALLALKCVRVLVEINDTSVMNSPSWDELMEKMFLSISTSNIVSELKGIMEGMVDAMCQSGCWTVSEKILRSISAIEEPEYGFDDNIKVILSCISLKIALQRSEADVKAKAFLEYARGTFCRVFLLEHLLSLGKLEPVQTRRRNRSTAKKNDSDVSFALLQEILTCSIGDTDLLARVWDVCKTLASGDEKTQAKHLALAMLVQYLDIMVAYKTINYDDPIIWELLQWSLLHSGSMQKKRGLHVLESLIKFMPDGEATKWRRFVQVFTAIDDTSFHLFNDNWEEMKQLHPENAGEDRLPFQWIELVWTMAIGHAQSTAQKIAITDFLHRSWSKADLQDLSSNFLKGALIPAFAQPGLSKGMHAQDIQKGIEIFFRKWALSRETDESFCDLLGALLEGLYSYPQQQIILFCSKALTVVCSTRGNVKAQEETYDMIIKAAKAQHIFGANRDAIKCYESLMHASSTCMDICSQSKFDRAMLWIDTIPKALIQPEGPLNMLALKTFRKIFGLSEDGKTIVDGERGQNLRGYILSLWSTGGHEFYDKQFLKILDASIKYCIVLLFSSKDDIVDILLNPMDHLRSAKETFLDSNNKTAYQDYFFLSSVLDMYIPLEDREWWMNRNEALDENAWVDTGFSSMIDCAADDLVMWLQYLARDIDLNYDGHVSCPNIIKIYESSLVEIENKGIKDVQVINIEPFLDPSVSIFREKSSLQFQCINQIVQVIIIINQGRMLHNDQVVSKHETTAVLVRLLNHLACSYKDIISFYAAHPETSISMPNLTKHSFFEISALAMRHIAILGDSLRKLYLSNCTCLAETSCTCDTCSYVSCDSLWVSQHGQGREWHACLSNIIDMSLNNLQYAYTDESMGDFLNNDRLTALKISGKENKRRCTTIEHWFALSSWRAIEACLSLKVAPCCGNIQADAITNQMQSSIIANCLKGLRSTFDGDLSIIHIVHCIRCLIPVIVQNWNLKIEQTFSIMTENGWDETPLEDQNSETFFKTIGSSLLEVLKSQSRRRMGISVAIVTTLLHPYCFLANKILESNCFTALHGDGGLLVGLLHQMLMMGKTYNRLFVQISCHLGALLLQRPACAGGYLNIIQQLSLSGFDHEMSAQSMQDQVLDVATATELSSLMICVPPEIKSAYEQSDCAPRIAILCLLHQWIQRGLQGDVDCMNNCRALWRSLYAHSRSDGDMAKDCYNHGGDIHKKKLRLWQTLTLICPSIPEEKVPETLSNILQDLDRVNAVSVKQYQETIGLTCILRNPNLIYENVFPEISDYTSQRKEGNPCLFSMIGVAVSFFHPKKIRSPPDYDATVSLFDNKMVQGEWEKLLKDSLEHLLPWIGAFPHANRTFAQMVMWNLLTLYPEALDAIPSLRKVLQFFESNSDLRRLYQSMGVSDFGLDRFDIAAALKPTGVVCDNKCLIGNGSKQNAIENAPVPLVQAMLDYLQDQRQDTRRKVSLEKKNAMATQWTSTEQTQQGNQSALHPNIALTAVEENKKTWQRKIIPLDQASAAQLQPWHVALGTSALADSLNPSTQYQATDSFERTLHTTCNNETEYRQEIIVVASMIHKLPNLAGLTRTCEIFRAQKLIMSDISVQNHPDFASISVSANSWVQLEQVTQSELPVWLRLMKSKGYHLIGLEQTEDSIPLPQYTFDRKTILVLGAEKVGIPANILELLQDTVEIPQLGVIRSLNVHVSASICLYQYTTQFLP
jgi:tRNA G18 (ribose-2'-O)-methylase SpoU